MAKASNKAHSLDELHRLIGQIYDAALDPSLWGTFLESFADVCGGGPTSLFLHDYQSRRSSVEHPSLSFVKSVRSDPADIPPYQDYYSALDPLQKRIETLEEGVMVYSNALMEDTEFFKTEYYADFMGKRGYGYAMGGHVLKRQSLTAVLASSRLRRHGPFEAEELELCQRLVPHLQRACGLYWKLADHRALAGAGLAVLDRFPQAVALLDGAGCVRFANQAAETIMRRGDGFSLDGQRQCRAGNAAENARLRKLIHEAVQTARGHGHRPGGCVTLHRSRASRPLAAMVSPLRGHGTAFGDDICAVLFLSDPDSAQPLPDEQLLRCLYRLTPAEAKLAQALAAGTTVEDYAGQNALSPATVRTHLQHIFHKTCTNRQSELVKLLLGSPAVLKDSWR